MTNHILAALSAADYARFLPHLEKAVLRKNQKLEKPNANIQTVYFFETGIAAVMSTADASQVAIGLIGCEGASGIPVMLGANSAPNAVEMLTDGTALSIGARPLQRTMVLMSEFGRLLLRYCLAFSHQASQTALSNATTTIDQRVARWVLMTHDRSETSAVHLSHEIVASMLGVRRAGVTVALKGLERRGLLKIEHGFITVLDRDRIKKVAGAFYGLPEIEYKRLVSDAWPPDPKL